MKNRYYESTKRFVHAEGAKTEIRYRSDGSVYYVVVVGRPKYVGGHNTMGKDDWESNRKRTIFRASVVEE